MNYIIDSRNVSWERVANEVIAIQLETGRYYNLLDISADLWCQMNPGVSLETLTQEFSKLFPNVDDVKLQIESFLDSCCKARLILQIDNLDKVENWEKFPIESKVWNSPEAVEYSDLQDLILVDPIHDVDQSGWPNLNQ